MAWVDFSRDELDGEITFYAQFLFPVLFPFIFTTF
jgi:hypothetical protein